MSIPEKNVFENSWDWFSSITKKPPHGLSKSLNKKTYLIKIPLFEILLKAINPNIYKRLYGSLEVDNSLTKEVLDFKNPYSIEEGITYMIQPEKKSLRAKGERD